MRRGGRAAVMAVLIALPALLAAQRDDLAAPPRPLRFFLAARDSGTPPAPIDPTRVSVLRMRIAIDLDGVPLDQALRRISRLSGLQFAYASDVIAADHAVHLIAQDITVAAALTEVLLDAAVDVILRPDGNAVLVRAVIAPAQDLRGTVLDSVSREPIAGAVVMLLDSSRMVVGRTITDERGKYRISAFAPAQSLRVVRIGFQPREARMRGRLDDPPSLDVAMVRFSTALAAVRVMDQSRCPSRSDATAAAELWEQARAGLLATVVAREANPATIHRLRFERTMDGNDDRIRRFLVSEDSASGAAKSFNAAFSASEFLRLGFAADREATLFGPDADVLLDDAFAGAYCFRMAEPSRARPSEVGLAFAPVDHPGGRVDIDGTLWVDTAARVIRDIEFRFLGLPDRVAPFHPGGLISFRQMANGVALVDHWYLRRVDLVQDTIRNGRIVLVRPGDQIPVDGEFVKGPSNVWTREWFYATESGGELAQATWPDGQTWHAALGAIHLHSVTARGQPTPGIMVALPGTPYHAAADANGDIVIADLLPGPYAVDVVEPRMAELGLVIPTSLKFDARRDSTLSLTIRLPTAEEYTVDRCKAAREFAAGDSVLVLGRVMTPGGKPVADERVTAAVRSASGLWSWQRDFYTTGTDGVFQLCSDHFALGDRVMIRVQDAAARIVEVTKTLSANLTIVRVPIAP